MNRNKLAKIRRSLAALRAAAGNRKGAEFEAVAIKMGRKRVNRGKEPTYERNDLPRFRPLTIPGHAVDLRKGTALSVLDTLEDDADTWEQFLDQQNPEDEGDTSEDPLEEPD